MEEKKDTLGMLDLVIRPGFCVKENQIIKVNQAAESLFITPGTDIRPLLLTGSEEYAAFTGGCLYLTLSLSSHSCGASVTRVDDIDVFLLEQESDNGELRSMALAAREAGIRDQVKIFVGGAPISQSFCDEIGADYYAEDAGAAAREAVAILKAQKAS